MYLDETIQNAKEKFNHYDTKIGGTDIFETLEHALNIKINKAYKKEIFILTYS